MMKFADEDVLKQVRLLIERAREARLVSGSDREELNGYWSALASIEVPHALRPAAEDPASRSPAEAGQFFDAMAALVTKTLNVIAKHGDSTALQEAIEAGDESRILALREVVCLVDDCERVARYAETRKESFEDRLAATDRAIANRVR